MRRRVERSTLRGIAAVRGAVLLLVVLAVAAGCSSEGGILDGVGGTSGLRAAAPEAKNRKRRSAIRTEPREPGVPAVSDAAGVVTSVVLFILTDFDTDAEDAAHAAKRFKLLPAPLPGGGGLIMEARF